MATENQTNALAKWLSSVLRDGEGVKDMPFAICSAALSRVIEASNAYKEGTKKRGTVTRTKREVAGELREQGWISTQSHEHENAEPDAEPDIYIDPEYLEVEGNYEPEEQGHDEKQDERTSVKQYVNMIGTITEAVEREERIAPTEKGYAINMVFQAVTRDNRTELVAALRRGGNSSPLGGI